MKPRLRREIVAAHCIALLLVFFLVDILLVQLAAIVAFFWVQLRFLKPNER